MIVGERDERPHARDAGLEPFEADRLPDARRQVVGAPVPAEAVGGLPHVRVRLVVRARERPARPLVGVGARPRRVEAHDELVLAVAERARDVEAVLEVLVLGAADDDAVEPQLGERVEALGDELDALGGPVRVVARRSRPLERAPVLPHRMPDPALGELAEPHVGVVDEPRTQQVEVYLAGHGRGDRIGQGRGGGCLGRIVGRCDAPKHPLAGQVESLHRASGGVLDVGHPLSAPATSASCIRFCRML
nr:hypothetical protein [Agromyces protaetiae]